MSAAPEERARIALRLAEGVINDPASWPKPSAWFAAQIDEARRVAERQPLRGDYPPAKHLRHQVVTDFAEMAGLDLAQLTALADEEHGRMGRAIAEALAPGRAWARKVVRAAAGVEEALNHLDCRRSVSSPIHVCELESIISSRRADLVEVAREGDSRARSPAQALALARSERLLELARRR